MHVLIIYAHPSEKSFTYRVKNEFIRGLESVEHTYEISDLYKMNFKTDMTEEEYFREANYRKELSLSQDVLVEQEKINRCDVIVFIYPVFWTEAPAKLVGWFDRVWTYGFAYGERSMKQLKKAIVLCVAGRTIEHLTQYGHLDSMEKVMLGDRIFDRADESKMVVLDGTSKLNMELLESNWDKHLNTAYELGKSI